MEGIRRILHMQDDIDELRTRVEQLTALRRSPGVLQVTSVHR